MATNLRRGSIISLLVGAVFSREIKLYFSNSRLQAAPATNAMPRLKLLFDLVITLVNIEPSITRGIK